MSKCRLRLAQLLVLAPTLKTSEGSSLPLMPLEPLQSPSIIPKGMFVLQFKLLLKRVFELKTEVTEFRTFLPRLSSVTFSMQDGDFKVNILTI